MPSFSSMSELESFIEDACKSAVRKTEDEIKSIMRKQVNVFYNEYEPYAYDRTRRLSRALTKKLDRDGLGFEVGFSPEKLDYENGVMELKTTADEGSPLYGKCGWAAWGSKEVLDTAVKKGLHGGKIDGTPIWESSLQSIGSVPKKLKKNMIAAGLPIK